jgi:hypothetical protein
MTDRKAVGRIVKSIAIVINIALYILFIIIVLVFQFSSSSSALQCGGRVAINSDDLVKKQKQISIGYLMFCFF